MTSFFSNTLIEASDFTHRGCCGLYVGREVGRIHPQNMTLHAPNRKFGKSSSNMPGGDNVPRYIFKMKQQKILNSNLLLICCISCISKSQMSRLSNLSRFGALLYCFVPRVIRHPPCPPKTTHLCGITKGSLSKDNGLDAVRQERCAWRSDIQSLILFHKCGLLWVEYIEDYICSYCFMHPYWYSRILDNIDYVYMNDIYKHDLQQIASCEELSTPIGFKPQRLSWLHWWFSGSNSRRIVKTALKTQTHLILCSLPT